MQEIKWDSLTKSSKNKKITLLTVILGIVLTCCLCSLISYILTPHPSALSQIQTDKSSSQSTSTLSTESTSSATSSIIENPVMNYQITKEATVRYDGARSYYILIDPVDISNDNFKKDIKLLIKKLVKEKGNKLDLNILDDSETLNLFYEDEVNLNNTDFQKTATLEARHLIAMYTGNLATMPSNYDLAFFPGAFKDTPDIGTYVSGEEFNPTL